MFISDSLLWLRSHLTRSNVLRTGIPLLIVLVVAGIGTFLLVSSHAASPYTSTTADSGVRAGCTALVNDTSASNGNSIEFGASGCSGGLSVDNRWYSPASAWNTPIPSNPTIASNNSSLIAAWTDTATCTTTSANCLRVQYDYTPAIAVANNATPMVPVQINYPTCDAKTIEVPIPAGTIPDPSEEGHMAVMQADSGVEWDFWKVQSPNQPSKNGPPYPQYAGYPLCPTSTTWTADEIVVTNWQTGSGTSPGFGGAGYAEGAGTIRPRDTQLPTGSTWDHALSFSYNYTCSHTMSWCPYVSPAVSEDGVCTDQATCLPEGARFQLDPSIDCSTWPSIQYEWQRQMCRTLQVYGAIVVDSNGSGRGGATMYDQWYGSLGAYTWPWSQPGSTTTGLPNDLLPYFRVLAW